MLYNLRDQMLKCYTIWYTSCCIILQIKENIFPRSIKYEKIDNDYLFNDGSFHDGCSGSHGRHIVS